MGPPEEADTASPLKQKGNGQTNGEDKHEQYNVVRQGEEEMKA